MLEESEGDGEEFIVDALGDFEPMQGTKVGSDMVVLGIPQTTRARLFWMC